MAYYGRRRAYTNLSAAVEDFVKESEARMLAVMRQSLADVVENSQTPTREGGRMRVDTGFLRASGRANLNGWPSGESVRPIGAKPNQFSYNGEAVTATLLKMKFGDTFHYGWTAEYAPIRELYDGFLEASLQNWSRYVAFATDTLKRGGK